MILLFLVVVGRVEAHKSLGDSANFLFFVITKPKNYRFKKGK